MPGNMADSKLKTRFAPSPTGFMHLGNARTALFNALRARARGGDFLLRIEDTDPQRSRPEFQHALEEDLWWLGLAWHEGPVVSGGHGPYCQSERGEVYEALFERLAAGGHTYPCFCSDEELERSRARQRAAGRAPRYSGKCRNLTAEEVQARLAEGLRPTLRFRVERGRRIEFVDLVRGAQSFASDDIGDFIIRRQDGTPAFFFSNAVDDALMGVSEVWRGEDHLTNTPRQLLILEALGLSAPAYAHIALIVGADGAPLSKRHGSRSIRELRLGGYLPGAIVNYLARLGHGYDSDELLSLEELSAGFDPARLSRSPARYDAHQLLHWQHRAVAAASAEALWDWLGTPVTDLVPEAQRPDFLEAVLPNISFPEQAEHWARVIYCDPLNLDDDAREAVAEAGSAFFTEALAALDAHGVDYAAFTAELKGRTGAKGKRLFQPLRAALTGVSGGPELARLLPLLGTERVRQRLRACLS